MLFLFWKTIESKEFWIGELFYQSLFKFSKWWILLFFFQTINMCVSLDWSFLFLWGRFFFALACFSLILNMQAFWSEFQKVSTLFCSLSHKVADFVLLCLLCRFVFFDAHGIHSLSLLRHYWRAHLTRMQRTNTKIVSLVNIDKILISDRSHSFVHPFLRLFTISFALVAYKCFLVVSSPAMH